MGAATASDPYQGNIVVCVGVADSNGRTCEIIQPLDVDDSYPRRVVQVSDFHAGVDSFAVIILDSAADGAHVKSDRWRVATR